jgi:DNA-binding NarL/FixJ family response regulator
MIDVIIADDQQIVREGLKMVLKLDSSINIVGEAENGTELLKLMKNFIPDVILMDVRMPVMDGIKATKIIKENYDKVKVLILTTFNEDYYIFNGLKNGASGYIFKDASADEIINSVKKVYEGNILLHPKVTTKVVNAYNNILKDNEKIRFIDNNLKYLTRREKEIAKLIGEGKSNKEICDIVFVTEGTVKNHVTNILGKFQMKNRTELAIYMTKVTNRD